jgi:hypothetical protein
MARLPSLANFGFEPAAGTALVSLLVTQGAVHSETLCDESDREDANTGSDFLLGAGGGCNFLSALLKPGGLKRFLHPNHSSAGGEMVAFGESRGFSTLPSEKGNCSTHDTCALLSALMRAGEVCANAARACEVVTAELFVELELSDISVFR